MMMPSASEISLQCSYPSLGLYNSQRLRNHPNLQWHDKSTIFEVLGTMKPQIRMLPMLSTRSYIFRQYVGVSPCAYPLSSRAITGEKQLQNRIPKG